MLHSQNNGPGNMNDCFYAGKINMERFALFAELCRGHAYFYTTRNGKWLSVDTLPDLWGDYDGFQVIDINRDGHRDIIFF